MDEELHWIAELCEAHGPSGYEGPVRDVLRRWLDGTGEISLDRLGSMIVRKVGDPQGPKVMLAGHLDEIGLMVARIDDDGFVFFQTIGGWWEQVMLAQRVAIRTRRGTIVQGVVGSKAPHVLDQEERKKIVDRRKMFIDVGARNREEAEQLGIAMGDPITPICPTERLGNPDMVVAKAWDNRYGCAVVAEVLRGLRQEGHPNIVYGVATVQEEVGLRGARTAAQSIGPDVALSLDVGIAGDTPGMEPYEAQAKVGKGPCLLCYDGSLIPNQALRHLALQVAAEEGIDVQQDVLRQGGTDAGAIHLTGAGVPSLVIGVPTRYIHSAASVFSLSDYHGAVRLVSALVHRLDRATVDGLVS